MIIFAFNWGEKGGSAITIYGMKISMIKNYDKAIAFLRRVVRVYVETNGYDQANIPYLEKIAVISDEQGETHASEMAGGFSEDIRLGASTTR